MAQAERKGGFFCKECGNESPRWAGKCPACGQWNTLVEAPAAHRGRGRWVAPAAAQPVQLSDVAAAAAPRIVLPSAELNRVLGGGIVPGSVILLAGDPGIGKSTLFLQVASALAGRGEVLYVSGEESGHQVRLRSERLGVDGRGIFLLNETALEPVMAHLGRMAPSAVLVDSIQTLWSDAMPSAPGSVNQVRECTRQLMQWAKATHTPVLFAGHVTKDGDVAGPRVLEHMVDVVLYLEGESSGPLRLLRSTKNRFGSTNEVAVFQMGAEGLVEVPDPSRLMLAARSTAQVGDVVVPVLEGTRPMLMEVQALTAPTSAPAPRRLTSGLDQGRLVMLCAVLGQRARLPLGGCDVIANVAGGLRITEPAADLAVALAVASSLRGVPLAVDTVAVGEVSLSGELRSVPQMERRLRESARLGFRRAIVPPTRGQALPDMGLEVVEAGTLSEAVRAALPRGERAHRGPRITEEARNDHDYDE
ncbi:MAG: DNA repair protein RadA [Dehalococcoidia bacterium]|nr:DNA repair protein RadA [Dehalococcoidia bacterium]